MKKYSVLVLVLVLTAALFVGCGCTNTTKMETTPAPSTVPTTHATTQPTTEMTEMTTMPTTTASEPSETIDNGNGPLPDTTTATDSTLAGDAARSRQRMPIE